MALITCTDCGHAVSDAAPACPQCGRPISKVPAPRAAAKKTSVGETIGGIIVLGAMIAGVWSCSGDSEGDKQAKVAEREKAATEAAACVKDIQCAGHAHIIEAMRECKRPIEAKAAYEVKWATDNYFTRYRWAPAAPSHIMYFGDAASFQNAFGAYAPVKYMCEFDPQTKTVVDVLVEDGRFSE